MIKTEKGVLQVKGDIQEIKTDLFIIVHGLYCEVFKKEMSEEEAQEEILEAVHDGFKDEEELCDVTETFEELLDEFEGFLKKLKGMGKK